MASTALGIVGGVIGSAFGMPQIGFMLGSALGSAMFPPKGPDGPRLSDLKVQSSEYGRPIPIVYGLFRLAGNVVWSTPLQEHPHEEDSGSGGGGSTSYTYTASFAISFCEPVAGYLRLWADGKLIYDARTEGEPTIAFSAASHVFYLGGEDQLPDPTIEAVMGVGNVPAYRGQAYIVFTDLELGKYGNRLPNITAEVFTAGETITTTGGTDITFSGTDVGRVSEQVMYNPFAEEVWVTSTLSDLAIEDTTNVITRLDATTMEVVGHISLDSFLQIDHQGVLDESNGTVWYFATDPFTSSNNKYILKFDAISGTLLLKAPFSYTVDAAMINPVTWTLYVMSSSMIIHVNKTTGAAGTQHSVGSQRVLKAAFDSTGLMWFCSYNSMKPTLQTYSEATGAIATAFTASLDDVNDVVYDSTRNSIWFHYNGTAVDTYYEYNITTSSLTGNTVAMPSGSYVWYISYDVARDLFWLSNQTTGELVAVEPMADTVFAEYTYTGQNRPAQFQEGTGAVYIFDTHNPPEGKYRQARRLYSETTVTTSVSTINLAHIVTDISRRCGLPATKLNVSQLIPITVPGYAITSNMAGSSATEPLLFAYFAEAVESDGKMKYVRRGGASVVTIDSTETLLNGTE